MAAQALGGAALLLLAFPAVSFAQALPPQDAQKFRQAVEDFRAQRVQEAAQRLRELERAHPAHFDIQHLLAITLDLSGHPAQANRHFQQAVQLRPDAFQARINYGTNLNRLGRWEEAVEQFETTLGLDPKNATAHFNLGMIYLGRQVFDKALPWLQEARQLQPGVYENGYQLAFCHFALGEHGPARKVLDSLGTVPRQRGEFYLLKALNQRALGDPAADRSLSEALETVSDSPAAHAQVATLLLGQGMFRQALPILAAAVERFPDSDTALLNLARVEFALGDASARQSAERALKLRETPQAHRLLGDILDAADEVQAAASHYQRAVESDPGEDSFYTLGYFFLRHWNWEAAERVFSAGLAKVEASQRLLLGQGAARLGQGNDPGATQSFLEAARSPEAPLAAMHLLAQSFARAPDHFEEAAQRFEQFYRDSPQDPWAGYYFALAAFRRAEQAGDFPDHSLAVHVLQQAAANKSSFFEAYWLLGEIHFHLQDWEGAAEALEQAAQLNPEHVETRYKLALSLQRTGRPDRARAELQVYQELKAQHNQEASQRMAQTKKLIIEMSGKPGGSC